MWLRLFSVLLILSILPAVYTAEAVQEQQNLIVPANCPEQRPQLEAVQRVKRKIERNKYLYETGQPTETTDAEYDGLVLYLQRVMHCFPELSVTPVSPGAKKPDRDPVKHFAPMLSLNKVQDAD